MKLIAPPEGALSRHFTWDEAACNHCGMIGAGTVTAIRKQAKTMEAIRARFGRSVTVNSWFRCPLKNKAAGGEQNSFHLRGMATDFTVDGHDPREVQRTLHDFDGGLGAYPSFTHADHGPKRRWRG